MSVGIEIKDSLFNHLRRELEEASTIILYFENGMNYTAWSKEVSYNELLEETDEFYKHLTTIGLYDVEGNVTEYALTTDEETDEFIWLWLEN